MTKHQRKEKAVELAGSIITLTLGADVEMTIIIRDSDDDNANITVRSNIETTANIAKLLYRLADHFAAQNTLTQER
jgi:hypothetical protein